MKEITNFFVGVSLGQMREHTGIAVVERITQQREVITPTCGIEYEDADLPPRFQCTHLERVPVGTRYPKIVERLIHLKDSLGEGTSILADITMAGRPVSQLMQRAGLNFTPVVLSNGDRSATNEGVTYIPKRELIANVLVMLHESNIEFASTLQNTDVLREEMFSYQEKESGSPLEAAAIWRTGKNDDLLFSMAMAAWQARRPGDTVFSREVLETLARL